MNIMRRKEERKENKKRHERYRAYYWHNQIKYMLNLSIAFFVFDIIGILIAPIEYSDNVKWGIIKYGAGLPFTFSFILFSIWLLKSKKLRAERKPVLAEGFMLVAATLLAVWGDLGIEISILSRQEINLLMYLIMLGIITAFYIFPPFHYFIIIFVSYAVATFIFLKYPLVIMDTTSAICAVIMMLILYRLGYNRYITGRNRFEAEAKNVSLMQELEAQNEELNAGNQELLAINEELTEMDAKLKTAMENLEDSVELQKNFTSAMNHELRAPLNGILGNIQVILMDDNLSYEIREQLNQCMLLCKSLLSIVNDLLDAAKLEAGEFEILPAEFDLHAVINNVIGIFRNEILKKNLEFKLDIPDDMVCGLYGDDFRIQQVITNLVSNAVKYTDKGNILFSVRLECENLKITIADTGQGMTKEAIKILFQPFKRINESKNKKIVGTGLGMSIVDQLVKKMEGSIKVESTPGEGSTFTVLIPTKITDPSNTWGQIKEADTQKKFYMEEISMLEGLKVLYVDDTKMNHTVIRGLLKTTGISFDAFEDPLMGLEAALVNKYDIFLLDHQMPGMSGPELLERIRKESEKNFKTPAIALTGNTGVGIAKMYYELGFSGYLTKPVLREDLLKTLIKVAEDEEKG